MVDTNFLLQSSTPTRCFSMLTKASDALVGFLLEKGVTAVFGIIGSANSHIYNSLSEAGLQVWNMHHEQAVVLAAGAYYRTSRKLAVALVTAGGGASNAFTGIASLWADSIPCLIISGQEKLEYVRGHAHRRMLGTQGFDVVHAVSKLTKYAALVEEKTFHEQLTEAYTVALTGRKGPVLLDIPFDVQSAKIPPKISNFKLPEPLKPQPTDVQLLEELLARCNRPVILAGHGVKLAGCENLFIQKLNALNVPCLLTWSAIDLIDHSHPNFFGSPGVYGQRAANFIFQKCDLLIAIGTRLTIPQTGYDLQDVARNATIVMVDIDESEFKDFVDIKIHADCGAFLEAFSVPQTRCVEQLQEWLQECRSLVKEFPQIEEAHMDDFFPNSYRVIDKISAHLKHDQVIVTDMGTALLSGHQSIQLGEGMQMFSSYGLGEMGYGLPAAFGAAMAARGREILCLNCDGGMMMNLQELQTIKQHNLRVKIVIFNNDGYLMIKHTQNMLFNGQHTAVDGATGIVLPDYMKVAKAFGYKRYQVKDWDDFDFFFPRFMSYEGSAICEIFMPSSQDFIPKVKGVKQRDGSIFAPPLEELSPLLSEEILKRVMGDALSPKTALIDRRT